MKSQNILRYFRDVALAKANILTEFTPTEKALIIINSSVVALKEKIKDLEELVNDLPEEDEKDVRAWLEMKKKGLELLNAKPNNYDYELDIKDLGTTFKTTFGGANLSIVEKTISRCINVVTLLDQTNDVVICKIKYYRKKLIDFEFYQTERYYNVKPEDLERKLSLLDKTVKFRLAPVDGYKIFCTNHDGLIEVSEYEKI